MSDGERVPATDAPPRAAPIAAGERMPSFRLPGVTVAGERIEVTLEGALADGAALFLFYRDDGMPVCTRQLRAFAQEHGTLREAGVRAYGVNANGLGSHERFQERDRFPFPLLSDFHGEVTRACGLWDEDEGKARRALVLVGRDGAVRHAEPHFSPGNLAAFEALFAAIGLV